MTGGEGRREEKGATSGKGGFHGVVLDDLEGPARSWEGSVSSLINGLTGLLRNQ